jgi:hypothetical protein
VVCRKGTTAGDIHCHMGAFHIYVRHLLQIVRTDEQKEMSLDLVYLAAFVFLLMFIGLAMTVVEFTKLNDEEVDRAKPRETDSSRKQ